MSRRSMTRPPEKKVLRGATPHGKRRPRAFASRQVLPLLDDPLTITNAELCALARELAEGWDALARQLEADFTALARAACTGLPQIDDPPADTAPQNHSHF